jgi:hypothetical protein
MDQRLTLLLLLGLLAVQLFLRRESCGEKHGRLRETAMSLRQTIYLFSGTLRRIFFVVLLACVLGTIYYTQRLVNELRKESRQIVEFYSQTYQLIVQTENMEVLDGSWPTISCKRWIFR